MSMHYLLRDVVLMPCRALEAFRLWTRGMHRPFLTLYWVLMPCRALEAFRQKRGSAKKRRRKSLNALSGIGGVQTQRNCRGDGGKFLGLNALSGIGGVQTWVGERSTGYSSLVLMPCRALEAFRRIASGRRWAARCGLNALSGIGGVQTRQGWGVPFPSLWVLMPCRALEAFRRTSGRVTYVHRTT